MSRETRVEGHDFGALYAEVQQFYSKHMHLLDTGAAKDWADSFTEDGVFSPPSAPEPIVGRAALAAGAAEAKAVLLAKGEQHRHLLLNMDIDPQADGTLRVRSYAPVVATPIGGEPRLFVMCVMNDVLVREGERYLVKHRIVTRDDRPKGSVV